MKQFSVTNTFCGAGLIAVNLLCSLPVAAQGSDSVVRPSEFAADNAIVDTSIPFAIGANEAQQSLRGAFGWPTFQEGLVEGVYFRFDPDGYARFSPNPRLDVDVFEVLCKSRTKDCHARKAGLTVILTPRGQLQLAVEGVVAGDTFFLSEGVSEIPVPERVLQPLDVQMENLLSSSLELIVRRGNEDVSRHSLRGFLAASAYLRWITNKQDYAVLPRNWPVPNGRQVNTPSQITQNGNWQSPMPQPQVIAIAPAVPATPPPPRGEVDHIDAQLQDLRKMLLQLRDDRAADSETSPQPGPDATERLEKQVLELAAQIQDLRAQPNLGVPPLAPELTAVAPIAIAPEISPAPPHEAEDRATDKLAFLVEELGLDLRSAVAVLELAEGTVSVGSPENGMPPAPLALPIEDLDMLLQPPSPMAGEDADTDIALPSVAAPPVAIATVPEYRLLSDYFRSAALPALLAAPPQR